MSACRRYSLVIRDRFSGVERGVTINLRAAIPAGLTVLVLPVLMGLGARWSALHIEDKAGGMSSRREGLGGGIERYSFFFVET